MMQADFISVRGDYEAFLSFRAFGDFSWRTVYLCRMKQGLREVGPGQSEVLSVGAEVDGLYRVSQSGWLCAKENHLLQGENSA